MAENIQVVGLMLLIIIAGCALAFNLPQMFGIDLGLSFSDIKFSLGGFYVILARIVGLILILLGIWVIINIIREG